MTLVPVMLEGDKLTVTSAVREHPAEVVYVIVVVPGEAAFTMPVAEPITATVVLLLLQVPGITVLCNVVVRAVHTASEPVIAAGFG
jgi:hypothetical protein